MTRFRLIDEVSIYLLDGNNVLLGDEAKVLEHSDRHHLILGYGHLEINPKVYKVSIYECSRNL